jgi:hypothetical protein
MWERNFIIQFFSVKFLQNAGELPSLLPMHQTTKPYFSKIPPQESGREPYISVLSSASPRLMLTISLKQHFY